MAPVPVIVKMKDGHPVLVQEISLVNIRFVISQLLNRVLVRKERGFMRDEHVFSSGVGASAYIERGHHRRRDAFARRVRSPGDKVVHRFLLPRDAYVCFYSLQNHSHGKRRRGGLSLRGSCRTSQ